jgi:hypothetical protein
VSVGFTSANKRLVGVHSESVSGRSGFVAQLIERGHGAVSIGPVEE